MDILDIRYHTVNRTEKQVYPSLTQRPGVFLGVLTEVTSSSVGNSKATNYITERLTSAWRMVCEELHV